VKGGCPLSSGGVLLPGAGISARRRTYFLLLRQKKVSKEKATLLSASLRFAAGNLQCSIPAGVRRTRFAQTAAALVPPPSALLGAYRRGGSGQPSLRSAPISSSQYQQPIPTTAALRAAVAWWPSEAKARSVSKPLCMRRGAERFADQGRSCLSEASSADPAKREHRRLPRSAAKGSQTVGSPFFCLLFFGEAKKSRSPAGARPGLGKQSLGTDRKLGGAQGPRALTPTLSRRERE
jgi:hypothetical protein